MPVKQTEALVAVIESFGISCSPRFSDNLLHFFRETAGRSWRHPATMFDLKKRNSLTLNCHEAEEFRRVAVRRKVKGAAMDRNSSHTGEGAFFKRRVKIYRYIFKCSGVSQIGKRLQPMVQNV